MSETRPTPAPAGWYPDPTGLPQQRWWNGVQWTHDVSAPRQDLTALPGPQEATFRRPYARTEEYTTAPAAVPESHAAVIVPEPDLQQYYAAQQYAQQLAAAQQLRAGQQLTPPSAVDAQQALPATSSLDPGAFPTRRELRERARAAERAAAEQFSEPHPAAPFVMPPVDATPVAPATPAAFPEPAAAAPVPIAAPAPPVPASAAADPAPAAIPSTIAASDGVSTPSERRRRVLDFGDDAQHDMPYRPFGMIPKITATSVATVAPETTSTWPVWVISVLPLVLVGAGVLVVTEIGDMYTTFMACGLLFIYLLLNIALAIRDRRMLREAGHISTASPAWVLLTPLAYLIARTATVYRETRRGVSGAPLWVWLIVVAGLGAAAYLLPDWLAKLTTTSSLY